ncbi:MAG TPA: hypothetical protein VLW54_01690 [Candidatus Acidoferrales bacterium]|nr:hypothetical protein [Candidatus Acidoferrales bacterium]
MSVKPIQVRLFFHDKCFDGAASAAVFTRFYRERVRGDAEFHYTGMTHRARHPFTPEMFDGDENGIVDFKYSSSEKLTWWFDHHQSAFLSQEDADHFRGDHSGKKFYNPEYHSCTKLLADVTSKQFGFNAAPLEELVKWGDIIDGAQYPDAATAVGLAEPAMKLALVIEAAPEDDLVPRLIPEMARRPMAEMIELPEVKNHLGPLLERHERSLELFRKRARREDGVVYFDLSGDEMEGYNKFIPYYLFPDAVYSVGVSASALRVKVSVGSNPWTKTPLRHNLAALCERYGGGGHARVAAISLEPGDVGRAQKVARAIAEELRQ